MDQAQQNWLQLASEFAGKNKKWMATSDAFQGVGLLAIAEALHRVAEAMESAPRQQ